MGVVGFTLYAKKQKMQKIVVFSSSKHPRPVLDVANFDLTSPKHACKHK